MLSHSARVQARQPERLGLGQTPEAASGCPIAFQQRPQVVAQPERRAAHRPQPRKAPRPAAHMREVAQQHIAQQRAPELPAHGIGAVAQKVGQLQGLLDLLEEALDLPAAPVEFGHAARGPREVVGEENHLPLPAIHLHPGHHAPQPPGIIPAAVETREHHLIVAHDPALRLFEPPPDHAAGHALLGARDPEDPALLEAEEMLEIHVSLVEEHHLARSDAGAQLSRAPGVILARRVDDGKARQLAAQIQAQMALGRRLAPAMPGPVQARGHQFDGRGIHHMDGRLEAMRQAPATPATPGKSRAEPLQMREHLPKKPLPQLRRPALIGVGKIIAAGRRRPAHRRERRGVQPQTVGDIVETERVRELRKEQRRAVAPRAESAAERRCTRLPRQLRHEMVGDEIANRPQHGKLTADWRGGVVLFFHTGDVRRKISPASVHFHPLLWDGCVFKKRITWLVLILLIVTIIGAINGAVIGYAQVPSFALTLGTLAILQTAALVVSGADTIYVSENRELVSTLFEKQIFNAPLTFWIGIVAAFILWAVLRYTILGQNMTAMGKNELGATLSAVPTRRVRIIAYALSGFMGGLAGLSIVAQAGSASASGLGSDLLLPGIAAALIGGTSISGGQTNPLNVVFGGLTVGFVPIAIQAMGLGAQAQSLVYGIFIIVVVALTTVRSRSSVIK